MAFTMFWTDTHYSVDVGWVLARAAQLRHALAASVGDEWSRQFFVVDEPLAVRPLRVVARPATHQL